MERAPSNRRLHRENGPRIHFGGGANEFNHMAVRRRQFGRPSHQSRDYMDALTAVYWRHKHWCWACSILAGVALGAAVAWFAFGHWSVPARILCTVWKCVQP